MSRELSRDQIEALADRAAQDGEHSVVAACQVLLCSTSSDDERRVARRDVEAFLLELLGR